MAVPPCRHFANKHQFVLGVDGCKSGWLACKLPIQTNPPFKIEVSIFPTIEELMRSEWGTAQNILIDMPIGLVNSGRRGCDRLARKCLGSKKGSSIFPAPRRPMLAFETYAEANAWGKAQGPDAGGGLSKQAWNILPKIKELDSYLTKHGLGSYREGHPELAFLRLNAHAPILTSKKTVLGRALRMECLKKNGFKDIESAWPQLLTRFRTKDAAQDDLLDACALSLSARSLELEEPVLEMTEGLKDPKGLPLAIWG